MTALQAEGTHSVTTQRDVGRMVVEEKKKEPGNKLIKTKLPRARQYMPVIPALRMVRQETATN